MRKMLGIVIAVVAVTGGAAAAWDGPCMGYGGGRWSGASAASVKKFQKETLALRDELAGKRVDLEEEYDKPAPDGARVASLRKEIVDLEAKIQAAAEKNGLPRSYRGRGMMRGAYGPGGGCGCW